ncbi:Spherulin-4 [Cytospora mali]|uniref:Spherulin-4 n=1 Tax=Cytospora mali TaxID=578113 RepID=A0A194VYU6_CYTMA|nr:Spherulin-4 [Valsa mali]
MTALVRGPELSPSPITDKPFILLPLYIYPTPTAWDPLYSAAASHPELDFLVVVNPGNGPGPGVLPDVNYIEALAKLTGLQNVRVIGYVHCSYGNRLLEEIMADVSVYRGWTEASAQRGDGKTIVVDGIFIDEVPSSTEFVQYLATLSSAAKIILNQNPAVEVAEANNSNEVTAKDADVNPLPPKPTTSTLSPPPPPPQAGPGTASPSNSTAVVIYNPGVVIDPIFYQAADYVVAFEDASRRWTSPAVQEQFSRLPRSLRKRSIAVVHSTAGGAREVGLLGRRCFEMGCPGQFITTQPGYTDWCLFWADFVRDMARRTMI